MPDDFIKKLINLRTDKNRNKWSSITCYQAPHKPFLLLSIFDHFAQGLITSNFIEPSLDLVETFNIYWQTIMPLGTKGNMAYPFPRLQNDGIFELVPASGLAGKINIESISSMKKLRNVCAGAKIDGRLFALLCQSETREHLRAVIINHYFATEIRPAVIECGEVNIKAYKYSQNLLLIREKTEPYLLYKEATSLKNKKIRDQGFRKAIVTLYDHRCALCGIRMLTSEGHTVVEAAHVKPWSESHNDLPTNGLCLCRLCHWSFDEGLMSVGSKYEVLVSKRVARDNNFPGHILTLTGREIFKPGDKSFWPTQENLEWHRGKKFSI